MFQRTTTSFVQRFRQSVLLLDRVPLRYSSRRESLRPPASHPFSRTSVPRNTPTEQDAGEHISRDESLSAEELLALQQAAIEALEDDLQRLRLDIRDGESQLPIPTAAEADIDVLVDVLRYGTDPIARARATGAASSEVVQEARNIYKDSLPEGVLTSEELRLYTRLYGEPSKDVGDEPSSRTRDHADSLEDSPIELYTAEGEQVEYQLPQEIDADEVGSEDALQDPVRDERTSVQYSPEEMQRRMHEAARLVNGDVVDEGEWDAAEEESEEESESRTHPFTKLGKFATTPRTAFLSQDGFVRPFETIMSDYSNKHLKDTCERTFGGPGLPNSPLTPRSAFSKKQVPVSLNAGQHFMGEMEANAFVTAVMPPTYASIRSVLVETRKRLGSTWLNSLLAKEGGPRILDAGSGGVGIIAWREIVQAHWLSLHSSDRRQPSPPPSKAVVLTGSDELRHRAAAMLENTTFVPRLPDYVHTRDSATIDDDRPAQSRKQFDVVIASHSLFGLKEEFLRKQHIQNLWSMLNPNGGVLILIEKGVPRGFEAIAGAREMLLERYIAVPEGQKTHYSNVEDDDLHRREKSMIVAPCTNHEKCPMYTTLGLSRGRKDICSFQQRYIRPAFLQRVLGAKDRNHDDVDFSYLTVMRGDDLRTRHISSWAQIQDPVSAPVHPTPASLNERYETWLDNVQSGFESFTPDTAASADTSSATHASQPSGVTHPDGNTRPNLPTTHLLPRAVFPPMKRQGHVLIDVCTPAGKIERWTVPRSFGKQAYHDARKAKWGDLWALGAKTRIPRALHLGTPEKDLLTKGSDGEVIIGKGRGRKERLKLKAMEILEAREQSHLDDIAEQKEMMRYLEDELADDIGSPRDRRDDGSSRKPRPSKIRSSSAAAASQRPGRPTEKPPSREYISPTSDLTDEQVEAVLAEWQSDFDRQKRGKGKKGGAFDKFGSSSKEAKRLQKSEGKIPIDFGSSR